MYSNSSNSCFNTHIDRYIHGKLAYKDFHGRNNPLLSSLCRKFGLFWRMDRKNVDALDLLAKYHDLGKVIIPDHILFKHGQLTDDEWEEIKLHPMIGSRMALALPGLEHISHLILSYHERWDGGGYPEGISREDIPFLSRILAVIDAYDAMITKRPYRSCKATHEQALEELRSCAGTQFDPRIARFFVSDFFWSVHVFRTGCKEEYV